MLARLWVLYLYNEVLWTMDATAPDNKSRIDKLVQECLLKIENWYQYPYFRSIVIQNLLHQRRCQVQYQNSPLWNFVKRNVLVFLLLVDESNWFG